jgi:ABC-2 type transport system permease protein
VNLALLRKCLLETRLLFGATALLVFSFCLVRVFIVASLEMSDFAGIVERLWDKWEKFAPVPLAHLLSYPGRVALAFDEPIVVFCISIFAISRGSDVVSGELNRGTLELLLAQPITRLQVLATQSIVTLACLALLALSAWGGTWCGIQLATVKENVPPPQLKLPWLPAIPLPIQQTETVELPMRDKVDPQIFWPGVANLFCLGAAVAGFSALVSALDRYRWRTIGIVAAFYIASLILKIVGLAFERFQWLRGLSLFTAYEPQRFIALAVKSQTEAWSFVARDPSLGVIGLGPLGYNAILLAIAAICYVAAAIAFERRDLPAPL